MEITINGQKADIILEKEKTVGEVLAGLEQWLANTGHRLSGLEIDGKTASAASLEESFERDISGIKNLGLVTSSLPQLIVESLLFLREDIDEYQLLDFEGKQRFCLSWNESPAAHLLAGQMPELFSLCGKTFSGECSPQALRAITDERLRELEDPAAELARLEPVVNEVCVRLEALPLDIQTGKDSRAAETVQIFSNVAEKIFRLYRVLKTEALVPEETLAEDIPVSDYINEFGAAVKELLAAYEQRDAVLAGDLAEYELAPRLRGLFAAMSRPAAVGGVL